MNGTITHPNDRDDGVVDEIFGYITATPHRSFFLFAGAGSGKTRTLVGALRKLTGIEPLDPNLPFAQKLRARSQTIRVITYTKNAALVIMGRLGINELVQVSTIHSFSWDLIKGFNDDIREALLSLNEEAIEETRSTANDRKNGPTAKDQEKLADLELKKQSINSTEVFSYTPDQNRFGEGALNHAQVLKVTAWLLRNKPTLRNILRDQHPVILIDESQDTMKGILDTLLFVESEDKSRLMLGLFGDHRQRIYTDGHKDLPTAIPPEWATPKLEMNHRSQRRIVDLINDIWDSDLECRTQSKVAVKQHPRLEKNSGLVRIFIGNSNLSSDEKIRSEDLCALEMEKFTQLPAWNPESRDYKTLALEHRLVARRGKFIDAYEAISLIYPDAARPDANEEITVPTALKVLLREMMDLKDCVDNGQIISEFAITEVLQKYGCLNFLPEDEAERSSILTNFQSAIEEFAQACSDKNATVREVLTPIIASKLFEIDPRLLTAFNDPNPPPEAPLPRQQESDENRISRGWHGLFNTPWEQLKEFNIYLSGKSSLATHQVVKGSEFEHVMVIMDDEDAAGFLFSYDKIFGTPPSDTDKKNQSENKETSIDRTLRLLYVTCSRARESLALVLWSKDPDQALKYAQTYKWFSADEVHSIPS